VLYVNSECKKCKAKLTAIRNRTPKARRYKRNYQRSVERLKKMERERRVDIMVAVLRDKGWHVERVMAKGRCAGTTTRLILTRGTERQTLRLAWRGVRSNLPHLRDDAARV
jgi:hypothetical protein